MKGGCFACRFIRKSNRQVFAGPSGGFLKTLARVTPTLRAMGEKNNRASDQTDNSTQGQTRTNDDLVAHLERLTGRRIKSRQDISDYVSELTGKAKRKQSKSQHLKNLLLATLLIVSAAQYYFLDVQLEILSQPTLTVFVPVRDASGSQRPYLGG